MKPCVSGIQLFDWRFVHVTRTIPELAALGYAFVHVSPPQHSNEAEWRWWGRYQPTGYGIGGPLGTEDEFSRMAAAAARYEMKLIADVVTCNPCGRRDLLCGIELARKEAAYGAGLAYLRRLRRLGASGFRFDAAHAIPPEFFSWALPRLDQATVFGEFVSDSVTDFAPYSSIPGMRMLDFPLLATMRTAFAQDGDLRCLRAPALRGRALAGAVAVTFVRNHDIERGQAADKGIDEAAYRARFGVGWDEPTQTLDRAAVDLAHAYLFARREGIPYVLASMRTLPEAARADRHDDPAVIAGLRFRNRCLRAGDPPEDWCLETPAAIAWQRGPECLAVINAGSRPIDLAELGTVLRPGRYRELITDRLLNVGANHRFLGGRVGSRCPGLVVAD